jgi:queuine tRNA-ribosyltransferase
MRFDIKIQDSYSKARAGLLSTEHGIIETPVFMPVGTIGTVKTLLPDELIRNRVQIILGNTYHLYLKPGINVLENFGGLHNFNQWKYPILTDSGGFQVYSLDDLRHIDEKGVTFKSHWDGSTHLFSPEKVVDIQRSIGSDIMMVLDYVIPNPSDYEKSEEANNITLKWADRSRRQFHNSKEKYNYSQLQFGIIQGGIYKDLRKKSIDGILSIGFEGYAIGGLAVGEGVSERWSVTNYCTDLLPVEKPRYLMGIGKPDDIINAIELGVDMFDCVIPSRNARNGSIFTASGIMNIRNAKYRMDKNPIEQNCNCLACQKFSRAYIRHMFNVNEMLGQRLATIHNIYFYTQLTYNARNAILNNTFKNFKIRFIEKYSMGVKNS